MAGLTLRDELFDQYK